MLSLLSSILTALAGTTSAVSLDQVRKWFPSSLPVILGSVVGPLLAIIVGYYLGRARSVKDEDKEYQEDADQSSQKP